MDKEDRLEVRIARLEVQVENLFHGAMPEPAQKEAPGGIAERGHIPLSETMDTLERGMGPDPWRHRSKGMKCATCMVYVPKTVAEQHQDDLRGARLGLVHKPTLHEIGRCRNHSPTMNGYPAVYPDDWCGDHKVDENKI